MKKLASLALVTGSLGAALIGGTAPSASAATSQAYIHAPVAFTTKAACVADENAFTAKVKSAGDTAYKTYSFQSSPTDECVFGDSNWTHLDTYYGPKAVASSDFIAPPLTRFELGADTLPNRLDAVGLDQGDSSVSTALRSALSGYSHTEFSHIYDFATQADCLSHFKAVDATLKANSNVIVNNDSNVEYGDPQTSECASEAPFTGTNRYKYQIDYTMNRNNKAPFGYEQTITSQTYMDKAFGHYVDTYGVTDANGNWKQTGTQSY